MLITEEYKNQNERLHKNNNTFGKRGRRHVKDITLLKTIFEAVTILDYGCGKGTFKEEFQIFSSSIQVQNYDPAIQEFSERPSEADIVLCSDVLEHIEQECLDEVLEDIKNLSIKISYLVIAIKPDYTKTLPDGRNPHLIVNGVDWWMNKLKEKYSNVILIKQTKKDITLIAQK